MNGYLLDTNIISEYNRAESPHPGVVQWMKTTAGTDLPARFAGRIPAIDKDVASSWARFIAPLLKQGRPLPTIDSLLAATALARDLTFVTRNVRHFDGLQAPLGTRCD